MSDKSDYRELCATEQDIPLHSKDWWLDAVCGPDDWDVVLVRRGEEIIASLPFYTLDVLGRSHLLLPLLTPILGPWIRYPGKQKYATRLGFEKKVMTELIEALPPFDFFATTFNPGITNWLPFMWKGFTQTTQYTYVIEGLSDLDAVFGDFTTSARGWIRKASKQVEARRGASTEEFFKLAEMTWRRQDREVPYALSFLQRLDEALGRHESREIFIAVDAQGRHHSGLYLTWDAHTAYVQLVGEDPELRGGAGRLLVWEAIQFTAGQLGLDRFDFLGSMVEGIEEARRSFGAHQVQLLHVRSDRRTLPRRALQSIASRIRPGLAAPRSD